MEVDRRELSLIKEILKSNPRGMTVTEISKEVKMNRHSVAKYLEILAVSGHIDKKSFGPSKVYYISQRLPISAMLSFSSDFIIILDKDLRIVNVNEKFLEFTKMKREDIIHKNAETFSFPFEFEPSIIPSIKEALGGKESIKEAVYKKKNIEINFFIKFIPTVFDDTEKGITIIFEDVTERKQSEKAVRESEQKFRSVIEQSSDGIILTDETGRIIEFNKGMEIASGYMHEDNIGKYLWESDFFTEVVFKKNKTRAMHFKEVIIKFLKTGRSLVSGNIIESDIKRNDGEIKTMQIVVFPIKTEKGFKLGGIARDMTERKRMEIALKDSEQQFRTLAETTTGGIVILQDGKPVYANHAAAVIAGYTISDIQNVALSSLIPPDYIDMFNRIFPDFLNNKKPDTGDQHALKISTRSGEVKWIDFNTDILKFHGREAVIITFFDITELKRVEEELQKAHDELEQRVKERTHEMEKANAALQSEVEQRILIEEELRNSKARYQYLVENINDVIWETDPNNAYVYVSPGIREVLGYEPAEVIGKTPYDFMPPQEIKRIKELFSTHINNNEQVPPPQEMKVISKDGREVLIEGSARCILGQGGRILGYNGISRDITQRKTMEDAIRASEEKYRNLVEEMYDWVWETDDKLVFTYSSQKIKDFIGYSPSEVVGKSVIELMSSDEARRVMNILKPIIENRQPFNIFENTLVHKDGREVILEVSGAPIFDMSGHLKGYRGVDRDVTNKKRADEKLRWNETFLRTMDDNSPLAIYAVDNRDDRILYYNKRFIEIWGLSQIEQSISRQEIKDTDLISYVLPQINDSNAFIELCNSLHDEAGRKVADDEIDLKDGRIIRCFSTQIRDESDSYLGRLYIYEDITERKRAENALWENQRFLTTLIGNLPGMIYRCYNDREWTMEYVSDGCFELTGYQPLDIVMNKNISYNGLVHPEDRGRIRDIINKALNEGKPFKIEYRIITASGNVKWVWEQGCESQPLESGQKMIEGFITDVTDKKASEEKISALASFPEMDPNPVVEINAKEQIVYMNPAAKETFPGLAPGHPVIGGLKPIMEEFRSGGLRSYSREVKFDRTTYSQFIYYVPEMNMLRIYAANITNRKRAEEEAQIVNRALRMVNDCNQAVVRATDEQALLKNICHIIAETGGYRLVWVGFAQNDEDKSVIPVARIGYDNGYVDSIKASWGNGERSQGPTGTAIKTGKPSIARYTAKDPNFSPWREEALKRGYASTISLPLTSNGRPIGALSMYSTRADAFDSMELKLLMELANDLAYGISSLRAKAEHTKTEETLELMRFTIERMSDAAFWIGKNARFCYVNESACRDLGYTKEELLHMGIEDIDTTFSADEWPQRWEEIKNGKHSRIQTLYRKKDGTLIPVEVTSNYIDYNGKQYDFAFSRYLPDVKIEEILESKKIKR